MVQNLEVSWEQCPAMATVTDELYWPQPFVHFYQNLQLSSHLPQPNLDAVISKQHPWLLNGLAKFKNANAASKKLVAEQDYLAFKAGKVKVEKDLRNFTFQLSRLLNLDEVQAHILIKRWIKEEGGQDGGSQVATGPTDGLDAKSIEQVINCPDHRRRMPTLSDTVHCQRGSSLCFRTKTMLIGYIFLQKRR